MAKFIAEGRNALQPLQSVFTWRHGGHIGVAIFGWEFSVGKNGTRRLPFG